MPKKSAMKYKSNNTKNNNNKEIWKKNNLYLNLTLKELLIVKVSHQKYVNFYLKGVIILS